MKKLIFLLLLLISFAQEKGSEKIKPISSSLQYELKDTQLKKDTVKFNIKINKYQYEALKLRKKDQFQLDDKILKDDNLRNDLLKHNQSKGKSNLSL